MSRRSTVFRVLLSGFVLTVSATTAIIGVGVAAASPTPAPARDGSRLEALVVDQAAPVSLPSAASESLSLLPPKPLPRVAQPTPAAARPAARKPRELKRAAARATKRPAPAKRTVAQRPARSTAPSTSLGQAVARIPGYGAHRPTRWVLTGQYGHWGATDLNSGTVFISPSVPASRLDSVVRHEWAHVLQIRVYGSASATIAGLNAYFGGSGITGAERAADCMALQLGATWTNYTSCSSAAWRRGAAHLLAGRRP